MRIAYLILAHSKPKQLARLVSALPLGSPVLIHFDRRAGEAFLQQAKADVWLTRASAIFVPQHLCRWGAPGIMWATLELIGQLVRSGIPYDYATLLSGQDYPIKSNKVICRDLESGGEFIECFNMLEPNRWSSQGRMLGTPDRVLGRFVRFRSHVGRVGTRRMLRDLTPFGGSQWWTLSPSSLDYVEITRQHDPQLINFLARSFIPDEAFMQTILGNSPHLKQVIQDDLRLAIWDRPDPPFPATLTKLDLPRIAESNNHFARKFDFDQDPYLPDELDRLRGYPE